MACFTRATSDPVDAPLSVGSVAAADQPSTTRGLKRASSAGAAEERQFAARLLGGDLAAVSPLEDVDTAIGSARSRMLSLSSAAMRAATSGCGPCACLSAVVVAMSKLAINLCGGVVLAPVAGVGDDDADRRADVGGLEGLVR